MGMSALARSVWMKNLKNVLSQFPPLTIPCASVLFVTILPKNSKEKPRYDSFWRLDAKILKLPNKLKIYYLFAPDGSRVSSLAIYTFLCSNIFK
jgi:hypothetical protein